MIPLLEFIVYPSISMLIFKQTLFSLTMVIAFFLLFNSNPFFLYSCVKLKRRTCTLFNSLEGQDYTFLQSLCLQFALLVEIARIYFIVQF